METSHRHLLHAEEGTWLNIDGFHMGIGGDEDFLEPVSIGGIPAERRSLPLPVGLVSKIIITGQAMSARIRVRKSIMYYLKNTNFWMFGLFFFFYFFIIGACFPFFRFGYMTSTISAKVIRVLFLPLLLFFFAIIPTAVWSAF